MTANAKRVAQRTRAKLLSTQWAIRPEVLRSMLAVVNRRGTDIAAIAKEAGAYHEETFETCVRDGIAYIPVSGILSRYMNLFTYFCGGQSYEILSKDLGTLLDDSSVRAIVWDFDTPGGEVNGCSEFARLIYESRGIKPQIGFISGEGCSAGYWGVAACERVYAADTAVIGCLGVQAAWLDDRKHLENEGYVEISIISSQTPNKNRDVMTDEGHAQVQRVLDALCDRFLDSVALYRGVSREKVDADFGAGDVFVGEDARVRGMVDGIMTLEELHAQLTAPSEGGALVLPGRANATASGDLPMTAKKKPTAAETTEDEEKPPVENTDAAAADDEEEDDESDTTDEGDEETDTVDDEDEKDEKKYADARKSVRTVAQMSRAFPELVGQVAAKERARILGIIDITPAGQEQLARQCIESGNSIGASAAQFLKTVGEARQTRLNAFTKPAFTAPATESPSEDASSARATADRILAAGRVARGERASNN